MQEGDRLTMSGKERRRYLELEAVRRGERSLGEAAERLGLSYRQVRRLWRRFEARGEAGLVHGGRGRRSNHSKPEAVKRACVTTYREELAGFGPTLAAEKLAERSVVVDHETLRRWLLAEGLWQTQRRRSKYRRRRARKERFGELVQLDGSHHEWFAGRRCCLMSMVDDATGRRHSLLAEQETTEAAMRLLWRWVALYGVPRALYTDRKNVYITDREPTLEEQLAGEPALTAFGKACRKLGIQIIPASSPQAKGRVERSHAVYQDRLVKEIRLRKLTTLDEVNLLLVEGGFDAGLNERFACQPADELDLHQPVDKGLDLGGVFALEETRVVQNDWTVRYRNRWLQIGGSRRERPAVRSKVVVQQRLDGSLLLLYRGKTLGYEELATPPLPPPRLPSPPQQAPKVKAPAPPPPRTPTSNHPWRQQKVGRGRQMQMRERAAERAAKHTYLG